MGRSPHHFFSCTKAERGGNFDFALSKSPNQRTSMSFLQCNRDKADRNRGWLCTQRLWLETCWAMRCQSRRICWLKMPFTSHVFQSVATHSTLTPRSLANSVGDIDIKAAVAIGRWILHWSLFQSPLYQREEPASSISKRLCACAICAASTFLMQLSFSIFIPSKNADF